VLGKRPPPPEIAAKARELLATWDGVGEIDTTTVRDGLVRKLVNQHVSVERGRSFHAAVEDWQRSMSESPFSSDLELQGWLDLLASQWSPPPNARFELAWGLGEDGSHIEVVEPEPHVYRPVAGGAALLTAGRLDIEWAQRLARPLLPLGNETVVLNVADWKTGAWPVTPAEMNLQVNAAGIARANKLGLIFYRPGIYYARDGYWDWGPVVEVGSYEYRSILEDVREAATLPAEPVPGPWCDGCWDRKACPKAGQYIPAPSDDDCPF